MEKSEDMEKFDIAILGAPFDTVSWKPVLEYVMEYRWCGYTIKFGVVTWVVRATLERMSR